VDSNLFSVGTKIFSTGRILDHYGIVFTAWDLAASFYPSWSKVADMTGNFNLAYIIAAICSVFAAALTFWEGH